MYKVIYKKEEITANTIEDLLRKIKLLIHNEHTFDTLTVYEILDFDIVKLDKPIMMIFKFQYYQTKLLKVDFELLSRINNTCYIAIEM